MTTYLLTWNPKSSKWDDLADDVRDVIRNGRTSGRWSCGRTKKILPDDRFFLLRQGGLLPRGIMASGKITSAPHEDEHWNDPSKTALFVDIEFDALLHPGVHPLLLREFLNDPPLDRVNWNSQSSGISIDPVAAAVLEEKWAEHLSHVDFQIPLPIPTDDDTSLNVYELLRESCEALQPDSGKRARLLSELADVAEIASQIAPDNWDIRFGWKLSSLLLCVGDVGICEVNANRTAYRLWRDSLTEAQYRQLLADPSWVELPEAGISSNPQISTYCGYIASNHIDSDAWPTLWDALARSIQRASGIFSIKGGWRCGLTRWAEVV